VLRSGDRECALGIAGASFICIAAADLMPPLQRHTGIRAPASQRGLFVTGIATVAARAALFER
jgi:hypothetical protein